MAIAKLSLVNIIGELDRLDDVIIRCADRGGFHPEPAAKKRLIHAHAGDLAGLDEIHEKVGDKIVIGMSERQMCQSIFSAKRK